MSDRKPYLFQSKIRNTKHETRNNDRNKKCSNDKNFEFPMVSFRSFCHLIFEFVSNFGFRYSDFAWTWLFVQALIRLRDHIKQCQNNILNARCIIIIIVKTSISPKYVPSSERIKYALKKNINKCLRLWNNIIARSIM